MVVCLFVVGIYLVQIDKVLGEVLVFVLLFGGCLLSFLFLPFYVVWYYNRRGINKGWFLAVLHIYTFMCCMCLLLVFFGV